MVTLCFPEVQLHRKQKYPAQRGLYALRGILKLKIAGSLIFKFTKVGLFLAAVSVAMVGPSIEIAIAASTPIACQPYVNGKLRETLPTFFCLKREDANALIELMEAHRLEKLSQKEAQIRMAEFQ